MQRLLSIFSRLWADLLTPSGYGTPYTAGTSAVAHGLLGACVAPFGWWGLSAALSVALAYWLLKERGDLKRGGAVLDGLEDTAMVALGTYYGPVWWPPLMLACGLVVMISRALRA